MNVNVHEFADKTPELNDIVPTQSSTLGPRKYTWATLLQSILKILYRGSNAPANTDSFWVMPDGKLYFHNGTAWVTASGAATTESHDYNAYVSPTGDNNTYAKGDSHKPASSIAYVVAAPSHTSSDVITLFAGSHTVKNAEAFSTGSLVLFLKLWPNAVLASDNITDMLSPPSNNKNITIRGEGGVNYYGVTYFINETAATKLNSLSLDFDTLEGNGTSANWDQGLLKLFCQKIDIALKNLTVTRSAPIFDFQGDLAAIYYRRVNIDRIKLYNTAFTAYNCGIFNFRQTPQVASRNITNINVNHIDVEGVKELTLYYSKDMHYDKSVTNVKVGSISSQVVLAGSVPSADYNVGVKQALIHIEKSNVGAGAFTDSVFNFEIGTVRTGGSLVYIGGVGLVNTTINIKINNAICLRQTPIIIDVLSMNNSQIIIDANVDYLYENGVGPVIIVKTASMSGFSKVSFKGQYRTPQANTKPLLQICTGSDKVEVREANLIARTLVSPIQAQSSNTNLQLKSVSSNSISAIADANCVIFGNYNEQNIIYT